MNTDPVQNLLAKLDGVKQTGDGQYMATCPAHPDRHASLSIGRGADGRALLDCKAGCETPAVLSAVGLKTADLFAVNGQAHSAAPPKPKTLYPTADAAIEAAARQTGGTLAGQWTYPGGNFIVARFDLPNIDPDTGKPDKTFRPFHHNGTGWVQGDPPGLLPLYRVDELPAAGPITVHEGERKADKAHREIGLPAVASAHGAKAAGKTDWRPLAGRDVRICRDNDEPGRKYAADIAAILTALDPPATVRIVELPGLPPGGDIVDWLAGKSEAADPDDLKAEFMGLADKAPTWTPPADLELSSDDRPETPTEISALANEVINDFLTGKKLPAQPTGLPFIDDHLDPGGLPLGGVFLLAARPNVGKSFIFRWIIEQTLIHDPNARAIIFDAEQDARHIIIQFAARRTGIPSRKFYRHFGNDPDAATQGQLAIAEIGEQFAGRLHLVCDVLTPSLIESTIARVKPTIILIDDLPSVVVDCAGRDSMAVDLARAAWVQRLRRTGPAIGATFHERKDLTGDRLDALFGHSIAAYRADFVLSMSLEGEPGESGAFIVNALCSKNRIGPRGWKTRFAVDAAVADVKVQA